MFEPEPSYTDEWTWRAAGRILDAARAKAGRASQPAWEYRIELLARSSRIMVGRRPMPMRPATLFGRDWSDVAITLKRPPRASRKAVGLYGQWRDRARRLAVNLAARRRQK